MCCTAEALSPAATTRADGRREETTCRLADDQTVLIAFDQLFPHHHAATVDIVTVWYGFRTWMVDSCSSSAAL